MNTDELKKLAEVCEENKRLKGIISDSYEFIKELHQRSISRHKIRQIEHLMSRIKDLEDRE